MTSPEAFGPYELIERIHVGGMAEVFRARDRRSNRLVAIKRILRSAAEDEEFLEMFRDEAVIATQLVHPNIAKILDVGKVGPSYYLALEFIEGKDLRSICDRASKQCQRIPLEFVLHTAAEVCAGLEHAHNHADPQGKPVHLVHRDVSPANVLVSSGGDVKIIDFGIAKAAGKLTQTQVGTIKGKFGYMSPEQVRGLPLDRRSDVFSLGICLWELLTLERLFTGDSEIAIMEKIRGCEVPPPSRIWREIPGELERVVLKALAKDVDERYASASALQADLSAFALARGLVVGRTAASAYMRSAFADHPALIGSQEEKSFMAEQKSGSDLDVFEALAKKKEHEGADETPTPFATGVIPVPQARKATLFGLPTPPPPSSPSPGGTLFGSAAPPKVGASVAPPLAVPPNAGVSVAPPLAVPPNVGGSVPPPLASPPGATLFGSPPPPKPAAAVLGPIASPAGSSTGLPIGTPFRSTVFGAPPPPAAVATLPLPVPAQASATHPVPGPAPAPAPVAVPSPSAALTSLAPVPDSEPAPSTDRAPAIAAPEEASSPDADEEPVSTPANPMAVSGFVAAAKADEASSPTLIPAGEVADATPPAVATSIGSTVPLALAPTIALASNPLTGITPTSVPPPVPTLSSAVTQPASPSASPSSPRLTATLAAPASPPLPAQASPPPPAPALPPPGSPPLPKAGPGTAGTIATRPGLPAASVLPPPPRPLTAAGIPLPPASLPPVPVVASPLAANAPRSPLPSPLPHHGPQVTGEVEMDWDDDEKTTVFAKHGNEAEPGTSGVPVPAPPPAVRTIPGTGVVAAPPPPPPRTPLPAPPSGAVLPPPNFARASGLPAPVAPSGTLPLASSPTIRLPPGAVLGRPIPPPSPPRASVTSPPPVPRDLTPVGSDALGKSKRQRTAVLAAGAAVAVAGIVYLASPRAGKVAVFVSSGTGAIDHFAIVVDGQQKCTGSPCRFELDRGVHGLRAMSEGYLPHEEGINITSGADIPLNITLTRGAAGTGFRVSGQQAGVLLSVDGKDVGPLPQELKDLDPGAHKLIFKGDRYASEERTIHVAANEINDLGPVSLKVLRGLATFQVHTPGAKITLVSGRERRQLTDFSQPVEIDTSKNWHVEATKPGHADLQLPLTFDGGYEKTFVIDLQDRTAANPPVEKVDAPATPAPAAPAAERRGPTNTAVSSARTESAAGGGTCTLNINSLPASSLTLDGKALGSTPKAGVSASSGSHTVVFIHPEHGRKSQTISCRSGETKTVIGRLND